MPRMAERPKRRLLKAFLGLAAALILLLATGMGLFRLATETVPGYRRSIERWVSRRVGFPMKIGRLSARWHGFGPELVLHAVALESLDRKRVLAHAQAVVVRLSIPVWIEHFRIMPSGVVIRGIHFTVSENARGHLVYPVWMRHMHATPKPNALLATLAGDLHFEIEDARLTLNRTRPQGPPVVVTVSVLDLRADDGRYRLHLLAGIQPGVPVGFTLTAHARGPRRMPGSWRWQAHLRVPRIDPSELGVLPRRFGASPGTRVRVDARFSGVGLKLLLAEGQVSARNLFPRVSHGMAHAGYARAKMHFTLDLRHRTLTVAPLALEPAGKPAIRQSFAIGWTGPLDSPSQIRLASNRLVLGAFTPLWRWCRSIPSAARWARIVTKLAPQGTVTGLTVSLAAGPLGIRPVIAAGHFQALGWRPARPIPGLGGLVGGFTYASGKGEVTIRKSSADFNAPWIFDHPIHFHFAGTRVQVEIAKGGFSLKGTASRIRAKGLRLALGPWTLTRKPHGVGPVITLSATGHDLNVHEAARDLPFGIFKPKLVHWFKQAFVSGVIPETDFVFRGDPARFPFKQGGGLFRVRFTLSPGEMHIAPGWPDLVIQKASGVFWDAGLTVRVLAGSQAGIPLDGDTLEIPDLGNGVLMIHGEFRGSGAQVLGYLDSSPLSRRFAGLFTHLAVTGPLATHLVITIPVKALARVRIRGTADLQGVRAALDHGPALTDLQGQVAFDNLALSSRILTGRLLGHRITINAWTEGQKTHVQFVGALAPGLVTPVLPPSIAQRIQGLSMWRGVLDYTPAHLAEPIHIALKSNLIGTSFRLPAPLGKVRATPVTADWQAEFAPARETWMARGRYGKIVRMVIEGDDRGGKLGLGGLRIVFGPGPLGRPPARGFVAVGRIGTLDLAGFWALASRLSTSTVNRSWRIPALTVDHLTGWGQNLPDVTVHAHSTPEATRFSLSGPDLAGSGTIPDHARGGPITLDFARIQLDPITHLIRPGSPRPDPGQIPALDLTSAVTDYGRMHLGRVTAVLRHEGPQTLVMRSFSMISPDLALTGAGRWSRASGHSRVALSLKVESHHLGHAFHHLALTRLMTARQSLVNLALRWHGLPWHPEPATLSGKIGFSFKSGRVFALKPGGAGRFIALFSLDALPRRLGLDFSDVFSRGLSYDHLTGDFVVSHGMATTHNVELFGPSIALWMTGQADLAKRSYDQVALVVPHVGSTLPIAGMIFGGPVGGGIMLAISRIFQGLIENMTEVYYHITGPWSHPVVKRIADDRARALGFVKPHS